MRQTVAKELRKVANARWRALRPHFQEKVTPRQMLKDTKREFYEEQRDGRNR